MALIISLVILTFVFFRSLNLKLIGISDNEIWSGLIFIFILLILVGFVFFG